MLANTFRSTGAAMVRSSLSRGKSTFHIPTKELASNHMNEIAAVSTVFIAFMGVGAVVSNQSALSIADARKYQDVCLV